MAALLQAAAAEGHSPDYAKRLLKVIGEATSPESPFEPLTERELDVLRLVADGLTNAAVAAELVVAQSTVKTHINRIYSKLGVTQRTQAVAKARELGLIQ
jgi:ATP/maltotriose-dependent transcriptional regulator MalT